ncbi:hypothetical protein [uncultured Friedmanniella sp.]|uniref:hypothetical protein n=1 Tax=uncultured Friedmanniella sp. TaxID=335381 RepID=UPI0035CAF4B8
MRRLQVAVLTGTLVLGTTMLGAALTGGPAAAAPQTPDALEPCVFSPSQTDINGDGFGDTVVGNPYATVDGRAEAGAVTVLFGDADRRIGEGVRRVITQADGGSRPEAGDHFGWSVTLGDTNRDRCADIVVGSPGEDAPGAVDAGVVQVIRFAADAEGGPGRTSGFTLTQAALGGQLGRGDRFGTSVALAPDGDGNAHGFAGAPGEDVDGAADAGVVNSFALDSHGAATGGRQLAEHASDPGASDAGARFGTSLAFTSTPHGERTTPLLLVGAPGTRVGDTAGAGAVEVVDDTDPDTVVVATLSQALAGVDGDPETGDGFGTSLAVSPWGTLTGESQILVGSPGEDVGGARDGGMINVVNTSGDAFVGGPSLNQSAAGLGRAETGDRFGAAVGFGPDDGGVTIGAPGEDVGGHADVGAVSFATRFSGSGSDFDEKVTRTLDSAGVPGGSTAGDRFGSAVGQLYGSYEIVVMVGVPRRRGGSVIVFSSSFGIRAWKPGQGGVPVQDGRFGSALVSLSSS